VHSFSKAAFLLASRHNVGTKLFVEETREKLIDGISNILILDHLNINHEKGRHDWLRAFYFDFLQCAVDPRKEENLNAGSKTLWANIGTNQFHLPEGKPNAQVLDGCVTLAYRDINALCLKIDHAKDAMKGSLFDVEKIEEHELKVIDPWGSRFRIIEVNADDVVDTRGRQPGDMSEGLAMTDLTINVEKGTNLDGIARFYSCLFHASTVIIPGSLVVVKVGPIQTLTFLVKDCEGKVSHADLVESEEGIMNYGAHISMYIADFPKTYDRAESLGVTYVNPRFKRRAYNKEEAIDQCMFRIIDIVDPENVEEGSILKIEHEVRSVIKKDGSKYKSCPFDKVPDQCLTTS